MPSTLDRLGFEAGQVLKIVGALASADGGPAATLRSLGWDLPPGGQALGLAAIDVSALVQKLETLEQSLDSEASDAILAAEFADVLLEIEKAVVNIENAINGLSEIGDYLEKTNMKNEILGRLTSILISSRIGAVSPLAFVLLQFFGVINLSHFTADPSIYQLDHVRFIFEWGALLKLFTDPLGLIKTRYGWGTATFDARGFIANLSAVIEVLGEPSRIRALPRRVEEQLTGNSVPEADTDPLTQAIALFITGDMSGGAEAGISMFPLRPTTAGGPDGGIAVCPFIYGSADLSFPLTDELTLGLEATVALDSGIALQFRPGQNMSIKAGLLTDSVQDQVSGTVLVSLTWAAAGGGTYTLLSFPGGGSIQVGSMSFSGGVDVLQGSLSPSFGLKLTGGQISFTTSGADSFTSSTVPSSGLNSTFNVGVRWSGDQGFSFEGSISAAIDIALNLSIGPVRIDSLHLELLPSDSGLAIESSVTCNATIGPVAVTLERFGALTTVLVQSGNLGPIDVSLGFKPPSGAGLSIDAAGVSGGGFLAHDDVKQEYSGVLQLSFDDLMLQAFGLISTQVAGGDGYSLLAMVDADFPPIQLGWGFTLDGVGGLMAVHRSANVDALRAAMKSGKLALILFPTSAITNGAAILAQLDALFPTASGRFLFGPMAQIGWGTPTLLTASVAVILELPEPVEIILLANLTLKLPDPKAPLIHINMDALGVLDLSQGELSLDASLYDSKLIAFTLAGNMALRANWGTNREFLLAIGGFHPQFSPPADFPALNRITIDMPSGIVAKLRLAAYFAVTSNSLQFGAQLDVFIGVSGYGLAGHLGFDALLQLSPFHFAADISGSIALMAGSDDLMSVSLNATLTGPAPWNIAGKFKIHVIFFDVHISFSHSWGQDAPSLPSTTVDVGALLNTALADPRSWDAQLPANFPPLVLTSGTSDSTTVLAHPMALLQVHESIVPLDLAIDCFGSAIPQGANEFSITALYVGTTLVATQAIQDDFAPGQFFDLSDTDKLTRPSFEKHDAGVVMSGSLFSCGNSLIKTTSFENSFIDVPGQARQDPLPPAPLKWIILQGILSSGAAARKTITVSGNRRFTSPGNPIRVAEPAFALADTGTLVQAGAAPAGGTTYSDIHAALNQQVSQNPAIKGTVQIVPTYELVAQ